MGRQNAQTARVLCERICVHSLERERELVAVLLQWRVLPTMSHVDDWCAVASVGNARCVLCARLFVLPHPSGELLLCTRALTHTHCLVMNSFCAFVSPVGREVFVGQPPVLVASA